MELNIMDKTKCITFDPVAQEALPDHIKAKMKADRDKAKLEAYHKQCPCWNSHNDSCYDDNCPCDRDCEYMKSINLKIKDLNESERKRNQTESS